MNGSSVHWNGTVTILTTVYFLGRFVFKTPYTACGKAHGEVDEQYMLKTILTSAESFPYVKRRSAVVKIEKVLNGL